MSNNNNNPKGMTKPIDECAIAHELCFFLRNTQNSIGCWSLEVAATALKLEPRHIINFISSGGLTGVMRDRTRTDIIASADPSYFCQGSITATDLIWLAMQFSHSGRVSGSVRRWNKSVIITLASKAINALVTKSSAT